MTWSTIVTLALILFLVSLMAQRGRTSLMLTVVSLMAQRERTSLNRRVGAHHRPLFGPFAIILICAIGFFMYRGSARRVILPHAVGRHSEASLDMQEDEAIHRGAPLERAQRAKAKAHSRKTAERDKVKQMIDAAATTNTDEIAKVSNDEAKVESTVVLQAEDSTPPAPPAPPPKWLDEPIGLINGVYYTIVVAGPHSTRVDCDEELPAKLTEAVDRYIDSYLGEGASRIVSLPPSYVKDEIVKADYEETYNASFGPMKNLHVQLAFDRKVCSELKRRYHNALADVRMKEVAIGGGSVLLLLGAMFSYLKLDTATRGYYTGRLRVATALAILGGGAAAFSLVRHL